MIAEFQKHWQEEYKIKTSEQLQSVIDKRNTRHEKNPQTQRDRNTTTDMDETRADGDDDDEEGYSEDDHLEDEDGSASHSKRRQTNSFNLTTCVSFRSVWYVSKYLDTITNRPVCMCEWVVMYYELWIDEARTKDKTKCCWLLIDKTRDTDKTYTWVSVWRKTKT
jgi:hypothetical protein